MLNNRLLVSAFALVLISGLSMSQAFAQSTTQALVTIDFSSGVYSNGVNCGGFGPCIYTEDGFTMATPDAVSQHFDSDLSDGYIEFHQGGANTVNQVVLSQFGGQEFSLISFDLVVGTLCTGPGGTGVDHASLTVEDNFGNTLNIATGTFGTIQVDMLNVQSVSFTPGPETKNGVPGNEGADICIDNLIFDDAHVGGEFLSIDSTALILANTQSFSWMIPVVLSVLGIGLFVVSRKSENS